jgi:hypothetical protein
VIVGERGPRECKREVGVARRAPPDGKCEADVLARAATRAPRALTIAPRALVRAPREAVLRGCKVDASRAMCVADRDKSNEGGTTSAAREAKSGAGGWKWSNPANDSCARPY